MSAATNTATAVAPPPAADHYTPRQVAELLGLKEYTVRRLMRAGTIKSIRLGGSERQPRYQRVTRKALEEYLKSLEGGA